MNSCNVGFFRRYWLAVTPKSEWVKETTKFLSSLIELEEGESIEFGWTRDNKKAVMYRHAEMHYVNKRVEVEEPTITSEYRKPKNKWKTWKDVFSWVFDG